MSGVFWFLVIVYFTPSVIALMRGHHNAGALIALNILLGWTVVGWIAAFVWSLTNRAKTVVVSNPLPPESPAPEDSNLVIAKRHLENIFDACREISEPSLNILLVAAQSDGKISRDDMRLIARFFAKQGADIKEVWIESIGVLNTGVTINISGDKNCDSDLASLEELPQLFKIALYGTFTALTASNKRPHKAIEAIGNRLEALISEPIKAPAEKPATAIIEEIAPAPIETPQPEPPPVPAPPAKKSWVEEAKAEIEAERRRQHPH